MGGLNSEIKPETTQLLFESAKFARDNIRKMMALMRAVKCLPLRGAPAEQSNSVAVTSPQPSSWIRCRARAMPSSVVYSLPRGYRDRRAGPGRGSDP